MAWMAVAAAAMQMIGGIMKGVGEYRQGQAQSTLLKYQGQSQLQAGAAAADRQRVIERARLGELHATIGASGVQMSGSPMEVYMDSFKNAALNIQDKYYQGKVQAWSSNIQSAFAMRAARNALFGGIFGGLTQGAATIGSAYTGGVNPSGASTLLSSGTSAAASYGGGVWSPSNYSFN